MWKIAVHLAVAGGVYDGVFLCCPVFPRDVLDQILDLIESLSESFPTYSLININEAGQTCCLIYRTYKENLMRFS